MKKIKKEQILPITINILILLFLLVFYIKLYPLVPYDGDDWYFIGSMREPFPIFGAFNPIKVLPEILLPLCGYVAAFIFYPLNHDYIGSISLVTSGTVAITIFIFFIFFYKFIRKRFKLTIKEGLATELVFFISFFFLFKNLNSTSYFGLFSHEMNCYFHYLIPGLLNAIAVLIMASSNNYNDEFKKMGAIKKGLFLTLIYFCIFSSIQLSIILASYCFIKIVENIITILKTKKDIVKNLINSSLLYLFVEFLWLISLFFEINGKRASIISSQNSFFTVPISNVLKQFITFYKNINHLFFFTSIIIFLIVIIILIVKIRKKDKTAKIQLSILIKNIALFGISFVYLTLLYAKTGGGYAGRVDATWAIIFYGLLLFSLTFMLLIKRCPKIKIIIPFIIIISTLYVFNFNGKFMTGDDNLDYKTIKEIDEFIINQIVEADMAGKNYVEVIVPAHRSSESNWPHPWNMTIWLQNTLYSHNITRTRMKIMFVRSDEITEQFYNKDFSKNEPFYDFERKG